MQNFLKCSLVLHIVIENLFKCFLVHTISEHPSECTAVDLGQFWLTICQCLSISPLTSRSCYLHIFVSKDVMGPYFYKVDKPVAEGHSKQKELQKKITSAEYQPLCQILCRLKADLCPQLNHL